MTKFICCLFCLCSSVIFFAKCTCCCISDFSSFCTCCIFSFRCYFTWYCYNSILWFVFIISTTSTNKCCFACHLAVFFNPFKFWCSIIMSCCCNFHFFCLCILCISIRNFYCCYINSLTSFFTCCIC